MKVGRTKERAAALLTIAMAMLGCTSGTSSTGYYYYDPYLYSYYYPGDIAYGSTYWAYDWNYAGLYYYQYVPGSGGTTGSGGAGGTGVAGNAIRSVGGAVRALARGQQVCPGQVTVTPKTGAPACGNRESTSARNGVNIVFNNCALPGGGTVNGTVDVQATQMASDPTCANGTSITVNATTTTTNLSYTSPQGGRLVIPMQTDTTTVTFPLGQNPTMLSIDSNGRMQFYEAGGNLVSDTLVTGTRVFTNSGDGQSYTTDGTVNLQGQGINAVSGTVTATGLVRSANCCRPTGGMMVMSLTGGSQPGRHTFTFGPSCGAATADGSNVSLPACY